MKAHWLLSPVEIRHNYIARKKNANTNVKFFHSIVNIKNYHYIANVNFKLIGL